MKKLIIILAIVAALAVPVTFAMAQTKDDPDLVTFLDRYESEAGSTRTELVYDKSTGNVRVIVDGEIVDVRLPTAAELNAINAVEKHKAREESKRQLGNFKRQLDQKRSSNPEIAELQDAVAQLLALHGIEE